MTEATQTLQSFRRSVRNWLRSHCPPSMRTPLKSDDQACWGGRRWQFQSEDQRRWFESMRDQGWTAPLLPERYGGGGLSFEQAQALAAEMRALGCRPPLSGWAITLLGPTLLRFGTEGQKQQHLPSMIRGETRWCQGFSEPNAGSDLASLQLRAQRRGDTYVLNGQKTWTTYAKESDWMFCLVRTDPAAQKHQGISFLLVDLATPGITFRLIPLISGRSEFYETHFENVEVPTTNRLGGENEGWEVVRFLLAQERQVSGMVKAQSGESLGTMLYNQSSDPEALSHYLRTEIADFDADALAFDALLERVANLMHLGTPDDTLGSVVKYFGSELNKRRYELLMMAEGLDALQCPEGRTYPDLAAAWLRSKGNSIAGGSNEMQYNLIARRALGLPRS